MKITYELDLYTFKAWRGGKDTLNRVISEGKVNQLEAVLEDCYPDGMDETSLNDILRFESDWVYEVCGIRSESVIREELEEAKWELDNLMDSYGQDVFEETEEEAKEIWELNYKDDAEELKEKIAELEEELENI